MAKHPIFTSKKRRVLRTHIPFSETFSALLLLGGLTFLIGWFLVQKENFDAGERDLSLEQLLQKKEAPQIYNVPFKPWQEPGTAPAVATENLGIFPPAILNEGWQIGSRLKQFEAGNLYEKINGEAEKFIRQGFRNLHYISVKSATQPEEEIAIELFDQGDLGGSLGVFAGHLSEDKIVEEEGSVVFFQTAAGAIGRKGQFFFRIAGNQSTETIQNKSRQLMKAFEVLPETQETLPPAFQILARMGLADTQISFQKKNVFQYDFAQDFWFGQLEPDAPARIFIHQAESPEAAQELFEDILAEHSYDYEILEENNTQALMFHEFLKNYFALRQQGAFVFGIENATDRPQIPALMNQLLRELEND